MRKSFKDFVAQDVKNTFLSSFEFAEPVTINGKNMNVVIDDETLKEQKILKGEKLAKAELLFYVASAEFEHIPLVSKQMKFNNKLYRIVDVTPQMGMLMIILERLSG